MGLVEMRRDNDFLVFSDAMEMEAVASKLAPVEAAYEAIMAGVDVVVYGAEADPGMQMEVYRGLVEMYRQDEQFAKKVDESVERVLRAKEKVVSDNR